MANDRDEPQFEVPLDPAPSSIEYVERSADGPNERR